MTLTLSVVGKMNSGVYAFIQINVNFHPIQYLYLKVAIRWAQYGTIWHLLYIVHPFF